MSTFSENYCLIKPDEEDYYDVADFNENMDTIDALMAETEGVLGEINEKIGTAEDQETDTLFGKLNSNSGALIKSIQTAEISVASKSSGKASINPVTPSKCIVIMERIQDTTHHSTKADYTLSENTIQVACTSSVVGDLVLRFQIIELY